MVDESFERYHYKLIMTVTRDSRTRTILEVASSQRSESPALKSSSTQTSPAPKSPLATKVSASEGPISPEWSSKHNELDKTREFSCQISSEDKTKISELFNNAEDDAIVNTIPKIHV